MSRPAVAGTRPVLVVGGPHHGSIVNLPLGVNVWHTGGPDADRYESVWRGWCRDPADGPWTDANHPDEIYMFDVVAGETGMDRDAMIGQMSDAIDVAHANGWTPTHKADDKTPFDRAGDVGMSWIGDPL